MHAVNEQIGVNRHPLGSCQPVDWIMWLRTFWLGVKQPNYYELPLMPECRY